MKLELPQHANGEFCIPAEPRNKRRMSGLFFCIMLLSIARPSLAEFSFKIAVPEDGVYRVSYNSLAYTGQPPASAQLRLWVGDRTVGMQIEDGEDGTFGPGDSFTFKGGRLAGAQSWFAPYTAENIYRLHLRDPATEAADNHSTLTTTSVQTQLPVLEHLERELLRAALPAAEGQRSETWYWRRLSHLDPLPFNIEPQAPGVPHKIRVALAGLSQDNAALAAGIQQHVVELALNEVVIGQARWNGQEAAVIEVGHNAIIGALKANNSQPLTLQLRVPKRRPTSNASPVIDLVLLNWVEIEYAAETAANRLTVPGGDTRTQLLVGNQVLIPRWIKPYRHISLRDQTSQMDYLIIAHGTLLGAIEPLARWHRQQGLSVSVVDVESIYDEFSYGVVSPYAIRDYIRHAVDNKLAPAARYVLLVGDASWDVHSEAGAARNLVPTLQVQAHNELAASDNGFVTVTGEDWRPDLAIGRIPAVTAAELSAVVGKIIRYAQDPVEHQWHSQIAWVTDMNTEFQAISNALATGPAAGFKANYIYPAKRELNNDQSQQDLLQAINNGQLLVHFVGHGGRFVWRTGPPDYRNSSDLFSVTTLKQLENKNRLPLVLSMTCSSGPFDHPQANSIAEAFLMLPDRGAIGVLAASWRVSASKSFSSLLIEELISGNNRLGEAVMKAKQREPNRALVESYNFLGDPALKLRLPGRKSS
ncbi:MAG: hypothetical protein HOC23_23965 [Halieaceae bacterium]|nr:hypothetical protein [Halieaceae bacterium]